MSQLKHLDYVNDSKARSSFRHFYYDVQTCIVQAHRTKFVMKHKFSFAAFEA